MGGNQRRVGQTCGRARAPRRALCAHAGAWSSPPRSSPEEQRGAARARRGATNGCATTRPASDVVSPTAARVVTPHLRPRQARRRGRRKPDCANRQSTGPPTVACTRTRWAEPRHRPSTSRVQCGPAWRTLSATCAVQTSGRSGGTSNSSETMASMPSAYRLPRLRSRPISPLVSMRPGW